ncbi:reverse transcriptase [Plakobranchus ocellatus]|uniref:Reverse transcriptase n=1 Tax=Plakobranchus ocellatus TaxID=259542 RepID=A0AAV4C029_9GAST|nr:reverse transcriptase [Plakobranchus ocellatus]
MDRQPARVHMDQCKEPRQKLQQAMNNERANEIQAENRDDVLIHPRRDKRHKINFPPASSGKQWEDLESNIVLKIDSLLGKSTLEHKLATFGDIVYQTCLDTFGWKQHQTKCPPQRSRRQFEMDSLRKQKRKLKKQIRAASSEETNGLLGGITGVFGCLEHATMIWEAIQRAKSEKLNLDVIWLDLANAYGSEPHEMIQLALRMYHVPEVIQVMLNDSFSGFLMRF